MMIPNRHRGEAVITVEGKEYLLRATFEALAKIEDIKPGRYLRQLILDLRDDNVPLRDLVQIVHVSLVGESISLEDLGEKLVQLGSINLGTAILPVLEFGIAGRAIGDWPEYKEPEAEEIAQEPEAFPIRQLLGFAMARLGMTEDEFYNTSPQALAAAMKELAGPTDEEKREAKRKEWEADTKAIFEGIEKRKAS